MEGMKKQLPGPVATPSMVVYPKPLGGDRTEHFECFAPGETLGAYVRRVGIAVPSRVLRVEHNGREVPLALWQRLIPRHGDLVVIAARGLGGGGGGKVLRTVAMLAVVAAGMAWGGALGAAIGLTGKVALGVGTGLIMIGGSMLVNALLPMPMPTAAKLGNGQKYESSPTYSIQGGRNRKRPWEPMLLVFGKHKLVPDIGANPFTEQVGDDQYLNQLFHFGLQGTSISITDLKIGNTPIEDFQGVQTQMGGTDGKVSMFPGNVQTIQGFTLNEQDGWYSRTTDTGVVVLSVELAARIFGINDDGGFITRTVELRLQYRNTAGGEWVERDEVGAVYATNYWSLRDKNSGLQVAQGSIHSNEHYDGQEEVFDPQLAAASQGHGGVGVWRWVPHPYQMGQPWVGLAPDPLITPGQRGIRITGARQEPTRLQVTWAVPAGQYEVRVWKLSGDLNTTRESNETALSQILAYREDFADYSGQCRLGVRIKASGQLNGAIDELSGIASAWCTVWRGAGWVNEYTSNPAWWFLWFARGKRAPDGSRIYGAGLADSQIDIEAIKAWAAWCEQKKLTFDYVLDQKMSAAAVLQMIARAGRASMTYQTGKLGVVWDAEDVPITAIFGPFNIKAGSFKIAYVNEGSVDEVVLNFVNRDTGYKMDEVRVKVPGVVSSNNPLQLDLDGCTDKDVAGREANLIAASQVWRRRRVTWETDTEGLVCVRGDVVSFSHDLTVWGYAGRLMPGSHGGTPPLMKLQQRVPSSGAGTVLLRDPDGNLKTLSVASAVGEVDELRILTPLEGFPMPGDAGYEDCSPFDWAWQFDPVSTPGRRFKVSAVKPSGDGIQFEAIDDDLEYYKSEDNPYQYTPPRDGGLLSGQVFAITFSEILRGVDSDSVAVELGWVMSVPLPAAVTVTVNGMAQPTVRTQERRLLVDARAGDVLSASVQSVNALGLGPPRVQSYTVLGLSAPLPAVTGLSSVFRDGLTVLVWGRVTDMRQPSYEVRLGPSWSNSALVGITDGLEMLATGNGLYWVAARFRLSSGVVVYGEADSLQIAGASLERNVILTVSEQPAWEGSVAGDALVHAGMLTLAPIGDVLGVPDVLGLPDMLWLGGAGTLGVYTSPAAHIVDIGYVAPVRLGFDVELHAQKLDEDILALPDVLEVSDVLGESSRQFVAAKPQVRSAQAAGVWSDWLDYVPGLVNARWFQVRLVLSTADPSIVPFVSRFDWTVDVPDLLQRNEGVTVPVTGLSVTYGKVFHAKPNVQITVVDALDGDVVKLSGETEGGFTVLVSNGGLPAHRKINWLAQGY